MKEAEALGEKQKQIQELDEKRKANIASREAAQDQKNSQYCEFIRDLKTSEALRIKDQQTLVNSARDKRRQKQLEERRMRTEQENSAGIVNAQREENIRMIEKDRDQKFAVQVKAMKDKEKERQLELEAKKVQRRLQEKETAVKVHEEEQQRRRQMALLEEQREAMIRERTVERNNREKDRLQAGGDPATAALETDAAGAEVDPSSAPAAVETPALKEEPTSDTA